MSSDDQFLAVFQEWGRIFMHRSMRGHIHYARKMGLSRSMLGTLFHVYHTDHVGVTDLGEHLGVSSAAASQMLERLVEEGLIERSEDPEDRRMKKISLTEKGSQTLKGSITARLDWIEELAGELTPEEQSQIVSGLQLMIDKVRELDPCPDESKHQ